MNKEQTRGRIDQATGSIKEATGKLVGNKELEQKGKQEKVEGKVQAAYGDLKSDLKKAIQPK